MKVKKWLSVLLSTAIVVSAAVPSEALAKEPANVQGVLTDYQVDGIFGDLPDNDELFEGYVDRLFMGGSIVSAYGSYGEDRLEGMERDAYQMLKGRMQKIASGELAGTSIMLSLEELGITKTSWTAQELGVSAIVRDGQITQEAMSAWMTQNVPDISKILGYLMMDCPLDLYWFDKTKGVSVHGPEMGASSQNGSDWTLSVEKGVTYSFSVAAEYQDTAAKEPEYTVNADLSRTAIKAAERAQEIVNKYADSSDFEKLDAYRQEICNLTSYNHEAADNPAVKYGNPWQLIWVFDGVEETSVVCEGYAKAFQYLCDLTDYQNSNVACYTVTGIMEGGTGAGGHMWNIVTMDDGKNYLADITNCDTGSIGAEDKLFLAAADKAGGGAYAVTIEGETVSYRYDGDMADMYGSILQISGSEYEPGSSSGDYLAYGTYGDNLEWSIDKAGVFKIEGTGEMPRITGTDDVPWKEYLFDIKRAVIGEGITNVGEAAFFDCSNLIEVSLPQSIEKIDSVAFSYCEKLESLTLGPNIKSIGDLAFFECKGLKEMVVPQGVTFIGKQAFVGCLSLKDVWFTGSCPEFKESNAFLGGLLTVHYPNTAATGWDELIESGFGEGYITWKVYCLEHVWEEDYRIDQEAGCTTEGSKSLHCTLCGEIKEHVVIPALGHRLTKVQAVAATCTKTGNIEYYVCNVCGSMFKDVSGITGISQADTVINAAHKYETYVLKATTSQDGSITKKCISCGDIAYAETVYYPQNVALAMDSYQYTGKELRPEVTVSDSSGKVVPASSYTVSYSANKAVGKAAVTITFQGNYTGTVTKTFVINPKGTSVTKLKAKVKGIEVKWKKQAAQTSGYQIQCAVNNKFKGAKSIKIANNKKKSKTVSKLKPRKKYYVRIRTYKTVKGVTYYSSWSGVKRVTTK